MSLLSLVSLTLIASVFRNLGKKKGIFPEPPELQTLNLLYAKYVLCYELPPCLTLLILQLLCLMFLSPHLYPWEKQCVCICMSLFFVSSLTKPRKRCVISEHLFIWLNAKHGESIQYIKTFKTYVLNQQ